jgi:hypothetical protein
MGLIVEMEKILYKMKCTHCGKSIDKKTRIFYSINKIDRDTKTTVEMPFHVECFEIVAGEEYLQ